MENEAKWYAVHEPTNTVASAAQVFKFDSEAACINVARMYKMSHSMFVSRMLTEEQVKEMGLFVVRKP